MQKEEVSKTKSNSVWKQIEFGDWVYLFNHEQQMTHSIIKKQIQSMTQTSVPKLGSFVMTPKGIGRLINVEDSNVIVKFIKEGLDLSLSFQVSSISTDFPVFLKFLIRDLNQSYMINVPCNGSIGKIKEIVKKQGIINEATEDYFLVFNGKEVKDEVSLDSLNILSYSKILLCFQEKTPMKLCRFKGIDTDWYFSNCDGITFSVNKAIRLSGIGFYKPMYGKSLDGELKVYEGTKSNTGSVLIEQNAEISPTESKTDCITEIQFQKAINIKSNTDYTIEFIATGNTDTYYGTNGVAVITDEKGIEFLFKYTDGSSFETDVRYGNFPELYYFA